MQEGRGRMWRCHDGGGDVRLLMSDAAVAMRPSLGGGGGGGGGSQWRGGGLQPSPPRKSHHHHHQQQQVPASSDADEHIIQPKTSVTTTTTTTEVGQNPNARRAEAVDRYSRVVFPVVFMTFSIAYWAVYINASSSMVNLAEFVVE